MKKNRNISVLSAKRKISWFYLLIWIAGILVYDCAAADDGKNPDENAMILRSGHRILKTTSVNSSLQFPTYPLRVADDDGQVRKRRRIEEKEEERFPIEMSPAIPPVARGYEEIYERFLNGVLIYKPDKNSDVGMVTLLIRELTNPLEGTFDLSRCGDTGNYLRISTGYWKRKRPENASKVEIWICPRFVIEKELNATAAHFKPIMSHWKKGKAPVGLFWTWSWYDFITDYDYLTTKNMDDLSEVDLKENWIRGDSSDTLDNPGWSYEYDELFGADLYSFRISFEESVETIKQPE